MLTRNACILAVLLGIAAVLVFRHPRAGDPGGTQLTPSPSKPAPLNLPPSATPAFNPKPGTPNSELPPAVAEPPAEVSTLADALNSPSTDIQRDLRIVAEMVATFRSNFPQSGNPAGNNAEITAALTGKNPVRFAFVPAAHPAINAAGELCDRWGTPFFFHAESATRMEIRSAGPDRKLYTEDDAVLMP